MQKISLRNAENADRDFMLKQSANLAEVAKLDWHPEADLQKHIQAYISENLDNNEITSITLVAENDTGRLGFIHACEHKEELSNETIAMVPLLAVIDEAQGLGVGRLLIEAAETWGKNQGYRLLQLEVFCANDKARGFYEKLDYKPDSLILVKELSE